MNKPTIAATCRVSLMLALSLVALVPAHAAPDSDVFVWIDAHPFGPGDRDMTVRVKLADGETSSNTELWVLYSTDASALAAATLGGNVPHGRATLSTSGSELSATFIFPHQDHPTPNSKDVHPAKISSGATTYYKVVKKRGTQVIASRNVSFTMPDKLTIANFGDSYASGEGAPYATGDRWSDQECHRSSNSGQSRAVKSYRESHAEVAVAYLNVACSGAQIDEGIVSSQTKQKSWFASENMSHLVRPQIDQVASWLNDNHYEQLDIALISIGGNDVGFGPWVVEYFVAPFNLTASSHAQARSNIKQHIDDNIPVGYRSLKTELDARLNYERVLVTEYPDPTRWKDGGFCGRPESSAIKYGSCWGVIEAVNSPASEYEFAFDSIVTRMNAKIREQVRSFEGWSFLDGAVVSSQRHGICNCDEPYFNTLGDSLRLQGDAEGTMHPNRRGHREIYEPLVQNGLDGAIRELRKKYTKDQAKELLKEQAARQARRAAARKALTTLQRPLPAQLPNARLVAPDTFAKAKQAPPPKNLGDDNRMTDDAKE
jgi:GDSL-like Lipase/Acylhydrolase family